MYTSTDNGVLNPINWNQIDDPVDKVVWDRLVTNFWIDTKIPVSNDLDSWRKMIPEEQEAIKKVFVSLTLLDTLQSEIGAPQLQQWARTQHEAAVYNNIAFMEAFAAGTELLTPQGWKAIEEVAETDKVAQYDPSTGQTTFVTPKVVDPHFSEEVYEISANNGNARQVVSGGHRVLIEEKVRDTNEWEPRVYEARELLGINLNSPFRRVRVGAAAPSGKGMTAEEKLLVAINADGTFGGERYTGEKTGTIPARFTFKKKRKIERLRRLADEAGWKLKTCDAPDDRGRYHFALSVPVEYAQPGREKALFGWWSLDGISLEWAQEFVKEIGLWDGHTHKNKRGVTISTTSKQDSDFIVAVATLAGKRPRTTYREDNRSETFNGSWVTHIPESRDTVNGQSLNIQKADPQRVYCVQVPSTFLVTRNGKTPVVSGNCVHAKSYSTIFSTLCSTEEIDRLFRWAITDERTQKQAKIIGDFYKGKDPSRAFAASVFLESFLFYTGFYAPLRLAAEGKLTNSADIIRLILRDEGVHGYYIGYKQQQFENRAPEEEVRETLMGLYETELERVEDIYDPVGWTEDVKHYLRYNANKALANLGYEPEFDPEDTQIPSYILAALDPGTGESHDFFSGSGASYVVGTAEETTEEDWDW